MTQRQKTNIGIWISLATAFAIVVSFAVRTDARARVNTSVNCDQETRLRVSERMITEMSTNLKHIHAVLVPADK